ELLIGNVSIILLVKGFLLFLVAVCLAISLVRGQLNLVNALHVVFMYFLYSQMWVILVLSDCYREAKRDLLIQEVKGYKTERFKPQQNKQTIIENSEKRTSER